MPSRSRFETPAGSVTNRRAESTSVTTRLTSSGIVRSNERTNATLRGEVDRGEVGQIVSYEEYGPRAGAVEYLLKRATLVVTHSLGFAQSFPPSYVKAEALGELIGF